MEAKIVLVFILLFMFSSIKGFNAEIYWRPFNGTIPDDAVLGGTDAGVDYYIGTGVVHGISNAWDIYGEFPGRIQSGSMELVVPISGPVTITDGIKVLCAGSNRDKFTWVYVTHDRFVDDLGDKIPAYGGVEGSTNTDYRSRLYIGRVGDNVGKVTAADIGLYIIDTNGKQQELRQFEVLAF